MLEFLSVKKRYYNPVEFAIDRIDGTWKILILLILRDKTMRYGELKNEIPHVTHKMLTSQLKHLEDEASVERKVYPVVLPNVEYKLTKRRI